MTTDAKDMVMDWWRNDLLEDRNFKVLSPASRYNARNMLAGFLQACEKFGHLDHNETDLLFKELAE